MDVNYIYTTTNIYSLRPTIKSRLFEKIKVKVIKDKWGMVVVGSDRNVGRDVLIFMDKF